jgi:hypothetical protein
MTLREALAAALRSADIVLRDAGNSLPECGNSEAGSAWVARAHLRSVLAKPGSVLAKPRSVLAKPRTRGASA